MQLGVIVDDLGYSQLSFTLLHQVYKLSQNIDNTVIIFQKDVVPPYMIPMCSVLNTSELFGFNGLLLVTSLDNLKLAKKISKAAKDIIYYMWDLEWLRNNKNFLENYKLLKDTKIIVQNKYHYDAVYQYCGFKPIAVIENLDLNNIVSKYESHI